MADLAKGRPTAVVTEMGPHRLIVESRNRREPWTPWDAKRWEAWIEDRWACTCGAHARTWDISPFEDRDGYVRRQWYAHAWRAMQRSRLKLRAALEVAGLIHRIVVDPQFFERVQEHADAMAAVYVRLLDRPTDAE